MVNKIKGLGIALVTPFTKDAQVDYKAIGKLVEQQVAEGADFLCILATTAETPCLTAEEKKHIKDLVVEKVAGRIPVVIGCSGNNTSEVVNALLTEDYTGIDGILSVCPYYNKPTQEGLYQHFRAIAAATTLPVILYNVPGRTGVNLTAATTLRLATDCDNIVAIKEASGDLRQIEEICKNKPEGFDVLSGDDGIMVDIIRLGGQGAISVIGNALTRESVEMVHQALDNQFEKAEAAQESLAELIRLLFVDGNPSGIKSVLAQQGRIQNILRLPLVPASQPTQDAISAIIK